MAISYVECADLTHNIPAVIAVIQHIYETTMYAELNTKSDYCQSCGFEGEIEIVDKNGKLGWRCPNCGNTNSLSLYVQRRLCGYLGTLTNGTSIGREGDIMNRVKHF